MFFRSKWFQVEPQPFRENPEKNFVKKQADEDFPSSQFERDVSAAAAASDPVLEKNATVKFNYLKWTRLRMRGSVSNWARFNSQNTHFTSLDVT